MSLEEEANMVMPRYPGGTVASVGTYINLKNMCYFAASAAATLPNLDYWHKISASSSTTAADIASMTNALLNGTASGLSPVTGSAYAYTSGSFAAYTSSMLPTSKGQGAQDA